MVFAVCDGRSMNDPVTRMSLLFERWLEQNEPHRQMQALGNLRGRVSSLRASRMRSVEWAQKMLPIIETARDELGGGATLADISRWLNAKGHRTVSNRMFEGKNLGATLFSVDKLVAGDAVMECRAKMSALALSANFEVAVSDSEPLQIECIERIEEGIVLARKLERRRPLSSAELYEEARRMAVEQAKLQRDDTRYVPMMARETYLTEGEFAEIVPDIEQMMLRDRISTATAAQ